MNSPPLSALVRDVIKDPMAACTGRCLAVARLAARGRRAVNAVLRAMRGPFPKDQHPRDVMEALGAVLHEVAKRNPRPLIDVLQRKKATEDPQLVTIVWALGDAAPDRVIGPLSVAAKHRNKTVRWAAASALARLRSELACDALLEALRDKSSAVQFVAVEAMQACEVFRTPKAIEPLKRIAGNARIQKQSPGLWASANQLLARIAEFP